MTLARIIAKALVCENSDKPCGKCNSCLKAERNIHPDITFLGCDSSSIKVDSIRDLKRDALLRPNDADRKVYIINNAGSMTHDAQDALLKILEEPPAYGVFILLSDNPEKLLPTVRSRCTELKLLALPDQTLEAALKAAFPDGDAQSIAAAISRSGGYLGQAKALLEEGAITPQTENFVKSFSTRDHFGLLQVLCGMEKWKRVQAISEWQTWLQLLQSALSSHAGQKATSPLARELAAHRSSGELLQAATLLQTVIEYAQGNVSVAAICGHLQWALR